MSKRSQDLSYPRNPRYPKEKEQKFSVYKNDSSVSLPPTRYCQTSEIRFNAGLVKSSIRRHTPKSVDTEIFIKIQSRDRPSTPAPFKPKLDQWTCTEVSQHRELRSYRKRKIGASEKTSRAYEDAYCASKTNGNLGKAEIVEQKVNTGTLHYQVLRGSGS